MKESRITKIQDRIIKLSDLRKFAKVLWDEWENAKKKSKSGLLIEINFSVRCDDNSVFTSEDISIFDEDSIINLKKVSSIKMIYWNYLEDERVQIDIAHGSSSYGGNSIEVDGNNSRWVNGTIRLFEEIISSFTPQNTFVKQHKNLITNILALGIGSIYIWFVIFITPPKPDSPTPIWLLQIPFLVYVIRYVFAFIAGYIPGMFLAEKLKSLWSDVEFQIGPKHTHLEMKRRLQIANVFVLGVLPILLSLVYDIGKALLR